MPVVRGEAVVSEDVPATVLGGSVRVTVEDRPYVGSPEVM